MQLRVRSCAIFLRRSFAPCEWFDAHSHRPGPVLPGFIIAATLDTQSAIFQQRHATAVDAEVSRVKPRIIVALGASALRAVAGLTNSIESARQLQLPHVSGAQIVCTYHPSAILRAEAANAAQLREHLTGDLQRARELARAAGRSRHPREPAGDADNRRA